MNPLFDDLQNYLANARLTSWSNDLPSILAKGLDTQRYGDLTAWQHSLEQLPSISTQSYDFVSGVRMGTGADTDAGTRALIDTRLRELIPWRKGPWDIHGVHIDTEWRSDWKWDRLLPHIAPLQDRRVLDVGCGNGYHCWRMLGAGAQRVIGIDPSPRFVVQFYATKHFAPAFPVDVIPATLDDFSELPAAFDTVFSMGVLYHRPSPMEHLRQLKSLLRPGGQLVLETLVIRGELGQGQVLVPEGRYARMNNVWFLPSPDTLVSWLQKLGFENPRLVNINQTSTEEQRRTDWMTFHSLQQFLDPDNHNKTVEGHPAPMRAIVLAENC